MSAVTEKTEHAFVLRFYNIKNFVLFISNLLNIINVTLRYILNYLRNGELLFPENKILRRELLNEADFYQVRGIIARLSENLTKLSKIITNEDHGFTVLSWLPPCASCTLLFRARIDGKTAADFHRYCDNKEPTLIVIQSGEYIFGGYTSKSWTSRMCSINF